MTRVRALEYNSNGGPFCLAYWYNPIPVQSYLKYITDAQRSQNILWCVTHDAVFMSLLLAAKIWRYGGSSKLFKLLISHTSEALDLTGHFCWRTQSYLVKSVWLGWFGFLDFSLSPIVLTFSLNVKVIERKVSGSLLWSCCFSLISG